MQIRLASQTCESHLVCDTKVGQDHHNSRRFLLPRTAGCGPGPDDRGDPFTRREQKEVRLVAQVANQRGIARARVQMQSREYLRLLRAAFHRPLAAASHYS